MFSEKREGVFLFCESERIKRLTILNGSGEVVSIKNKWMRLSAHPLIYIKV